MMPPDKTSSRGYFSPDDPTGTHDSFPTEVSRHMSIGVWLLERKKKTFTGKKGEMNVKRCKISTVLSLYNETQLVGTRGCTGRN